MRVGDHPAQKIVHNKVLKLNIWVFLRNTLPNLEKQTVGYAEHIVFTRHRDFTLAVALARKLKSMADHPLGSGLSNGL